MKKTIQYFLIGILCFYLVYFLRSFPFYQGDGTIINRGWFRIVGYQYEIRFDDILFQESPVNKAYEFSGVHPEQYLLELDILTGYEPISQNDFHLISHRYRDAQVKVNIKLMENGEKIIFKNKILPEDWTSLYKTIRMIHGSNFRFSRYANYWLQISISSQKPLEKPVIFRPSLYGGYERVF